MRKSTSKLIAFTLLALTLAAPAARAAVENVPVGTRFTYTAPGAGTVTLAGSFNGWDAQRNPLSDDGSGTWSIVMAFKPGKYEYKFVVDGAWFADPENPNTVPDSFGGANSLIEIGDDGKLKAIAQAPAQAGGPNTTFNARVTMDGRYLGRYIARKNYAGDPRYRMVRPEQNVDLNFHTEVSEVVDTYTRLRMDNTTNIILNNIHAQLDEGALDVHPGSFRVIGYWDMETLGLGDPVASGGDVDLPGTIMDDHLDAGKGTAGVRITGHPFGLDFEGFFADVHDADYYNNIEIFDNSGRDVFGARLSRDFLGLTLGLPIYMERELLWVDMSERVSTPDDTGIPALDRYLAEQNDTSTWYEWDNLDLRAGLDLTLPLYDGRGRLQLEWLYNDISQGFVTGNESGFNNSNGPVDVELTTRGRQLVHGSWDLELRPGRTINLEHTAMSESGAQAGETYGMVVFRHQDEADKRVYLNFGAAMASRQTHYTEFTATETADDRSHTVWIQRWQLDADYGAVGQVSPFAGTDQATATIWILSGRNAIGTPQGRYGWFELENAVVHYADDITGLDGHTFETILRWDRKLSRRVHGVADLRYIDFQMSDTSGPLEDGFFAPWIGL
ncbi:glycogen-binding domain-containing protein, partial [bacterium]|nr:glycogen-binding domain-containing protein [bacterium]